MAALRLSIRNWLNWHLALTPLLWLVGCASPNQTPLADLPAPTAAAQAAVPAAASLFALPPGALEAVAPGYQRQQANERLAALRRWFSGAEGFRPAYDSAVTRTASQTLHDHAANCLALAITTAAIADGLALHSEFQIPDTPWLWDQQGELELINTHINVSVSLGDNQPGHYQSGSTAFTVDLSGAETSQWLPYRTVSRQRVVAMFYNNRAAEALTSNDPEQAYALARAAVAADPQYPAAYATLGVVLRQQQRPELAVAVYRQGLTLAPDNLLLLTNLHVALQQLGERQQARLIAARLAKIDSESPFRLARDGDEQLANGHYQAALARYGAAIREANYVHQFYFGVAKAYWGLGDATSAAEALRIASALSNNSRDRLRYQAKLAAINRDH